ncbi:MAG: thioredoxin reductase [Elusimicrobia bacterium]|nr:MAG: thioredoxin reductase [Elusimicrobiota bacterium]KAF0154951.1 MAG: thioredoxin reductase [Elusimicrobiota bacterium]
MNENHFEIIVAGAGPAGLTAAIYAARGGVRCAVAGGVAPGGQLLETTDIENFPGFPDPVTGPDLMIRMIKQAKRLGAQVLQEQLSGCDLSARPFTLTVGSKKLTCDALVIATGARARWLGLESETRFRNKGVSGCATCDGFFFKGKIIAVVGGGDTAAEDALFLTRFAEKVLLIHRRDQLRAAHRLQEKLLANPKIEIVYDHVPEEFLGGERLEALRVKNVKTGEKKELKLSAVFIAIGHDPETAVFGDALKKDAGGYLVTDARCATSIEGVYAAGDVMDPHYRQAIVAAGTGCMAAMEALNYLQERK